jgi:outer membrane protein TolC
VPNPLPPEQFPQPYMVERIVVPGSASEYEGDYLDAIDNMMEGDNLSWSAGLTFNVPIGNRAAESDRERTLLNYEKQLSDLKNQERQTFMNLISLIYDLEAAHRSFLAAREARRLQEQNLATEERKYSLGLNTSYEVLQADDSFEEARSSEIGALIEYTKTVGRMDRARKGYLGSGSASLASIPINIPSGLSSGSLPSGIDQSMLSQYSSMLPAGVDMSMLQQYLP